MLKIITIQDIKKACKIFQKSPFLYFEKYLEHNGMTLQNIYVNRRLWTKRMKNFLDERGFIQQLDAELYGLTNFNFNSKGVLKWKEKYMLTVQ